SDDGRNIVIRPLYYVPEHDIARYARGMGFPIIPCNLCGSQENAQRKQVKAMLQEWARNYPGRIDSLVRAMTQVVPSHMGDRELFDFQNLRAGQRQEEELAFDPPEFAPAAPDGAVALARLHAAGGCASQPAS
ncbi:MAG: tRNA 2-thiocytidine(32) synthetase TtcA, partial [Rhodocyclaceae bacterium]|nr:tRNA 2-thiocytidine(32) synthetase TtcA [Rhodocyclaceae bacterium]